MLNLFKKVQKYLATAIAAAMLTVSFAVLLVPQKTHALFGVGDTVFDPTNLVENALSAATAVKTFYLENQQWVKDWIITPAVDAAAAALIWQMFDSINNWIKNGFDGEPLFVTDWEGYLSKAGNEAFGNYVDGLIAKGAPDICSPLRVDVVLGLVSYSRTQPRCTLDAFVANVNQIYDSFETYGWTGFISITTANVSNNAFGSILVQMDNVTRAILEKVTGKKQEAQASQGFLSWKRCVDENDFGDCDKSETVTPGIYVRDKLAIPNQYTSTKLAVANGIDGLISALAQQLIQMGLDALKPDGLAGSGGQSSPTYTPGAGDPSDPLDLQRQRIRDTINQNIISQENRYISVKQQSVNALEEEIEMLQKIVSCDNQNRQTEIKNSTSRVSILKADTRDSQRRIENINAIIADANRARTPQELTNVTLRMTTALGSAISERTILAAEDERDGILLERDAVKVEFLQIEDELKAQGRQCEPVPNNFLSTTRNTITEGESSAISWVPLEGTEKCVASDGWEGEKNPEGGLESVSPVVTTTYSLRCVNEDLSQITSASITITVISQSGD